jgi:hypothetical protein
MGAQDTLDSLSRQLSAADDQTLLKIVSVVDRLAKRGNLDLLLDQHRLRLRVIRPPRPMTLGRLLVLPFEDLLVDGGNASPGAMRVPRGRLSRLLALITGELDHELRGAIDARLKGKTMDDAALLLEVGRELWPAAAEAAKRLLEHGRQARDAEIRELLVPLRIAQHLLPVAETVVTTVWSLPPKPMLELQPAETEMIAELLGLAAANGRDCFQLTAELLVNRCELPLSIIQPLLDGDFEWGMRERQQAAAMIAEACLSEMVRLYRTVAATPATTELGLVIDRLQAIVSNIESLRHVATRVKFDHRELRRLKSDAFDLIQARLTIALEEQLLQAFETLGDASLSTDWRRLEQAAAAAATMRLMAKRIGLATKIDFVFNKALEQYRKLLLAGALDPDAAPMIDSVAMDRIRIIELLFGSRAAIQSLAKLREAASRHPAALAGAAQSGSTSAQAASA